MFLPLYINIIDDNIMFYRPNTHFFYKGVAYLLIQMLILHKQRKSPRFFVPNTIASFFDKLFDNETYQYERVFEHEVDKSTSSGGERPLLGQRSRELIADYQLLSRNERT